MNVASPNKMDYAGKMTDVKNICNTLGRKNIAERLDVGLTSIGNAVTDNAFPAKWYVVVSEMCIEHGIECPLNIFSFNRSKSLPDDHQLKEAI